MADEILPTPGQGEPTPNDQTTLQEPQATPEESTVSEEPTEEQVQLPSDVEEIEIPEKFKDKSKEEIIKAYLELERMKVQNKEQQPNKEPQNKQETKEGEAKVDGAAIYQEYIEKGELSEETLKMLEEKGYKKEEVIDRLEYEKFKQEKAIKDIVEPIGGMEEYTKLSEWAKENIPADQLNQFNEEFAKAGPLAKKAMIKDAYAMYKAAIGEEGGDFNLLHTNEPQRAATKGYTSQHELQKDLSDPRYGVDRSYTKAVEEKMARSDLSKL